MREVFLLLLVLACPLAMFFMMRGPHGHGGHGHASPTGDPTDQRVDAEQLRRERAELDRLIEERERAEVLVAKEALPLASAGEGEQLAGQGEASSGGARERRR